MNKCFDCNEVWESFMPCDNCPNCGSDYILGSKKWLEDNRPKERFVKDENQNRH